MRLAYSNPVSNHRGSFARSFGSLMTCDGPETVLMCSVVSPELRKVMHF